MMTDERAAAGYGQGGGYGGGPPGYGGPPGQPPGGGYGGPPGQPPGGYGPPGQPGGYGPPGQPGGYYPPQQQGYGPQGYGGQPQPPKKKGSGCMIALGLVGALVVIGGGGAWYVFHSAGEGDPCKVSGATIYRDCDDDHYCVNPDDIGDGTCMTESEAKAACRTGTLCKEQGKCELTVDHCTTE